MSLLEIRDLSLHRGTRALIDGMDIRVFEGDFCLLIGPNGAGKSSLLKCILSIIDDYRGQIMIQGRESRSYHARERARMMAYVPQAMDLTFDMEVGAFMELARFAHEDTPGERETLIDDCLTKTDTYRLRGSLMQELSGGERQRVLIAAAIAQQPRILVLDEPTSSLDPNHRAELVQLLASLHRHHRFTILLVTHDWNEFLGLDPKVLAIKEGKVAVTCGAFDLHQHLSSVFGCPFRRLDAGGIPVSFPVVDI